MKVDSQRWTAPEPKPVDEGASESAKKKAADQFKKESTPKAQTLVELGSKDRRETFVHIRGDYTSRGEATSPAVPAVLHAFEPGPDRKPNRLGAC